jgi:hypothetical protein
MLRLAATIALLAACYQDPNYDATHFKCDATHECPRGQSCVSGTCTGGGSGGDAPVNNQQGVACASQTCGTGQMCCFDFVNAPHCIAETDNCPGVSASCDGVEDCGGSPCCDSGSHAACGTSCANRACLDNADCTDGSSLTCCPSLTGAPWGRCALSC